MAATGVGSQGDVMTLPDRKPWGRGSRVGDLTSGPLTPSPLYWSTLLVHSTGRHTSDRPEPLSSGPENNLAHLSFTLALTCDF